MSKAAYGEPFLPSSDHDAVSHSCQHLGERKNWSVPEEVRVPANRSGIRGHLGRAPSQLRWISQVQRPDKVAGHAQLRTPAKKTIFCIDSDAILWEAVEWFCPASLCVHERTPFSRLRPSCAIGLAGSGRCTKSWVGPGFVSTLDSVIFFRHFPGGRSLRQEIPSLPLAFSLPFLADR